jgi:Domain of unknown function (DUF4111)/Nucleotidyltransferase domain
MNDDADPLLGELLAGIQNILGDRLVGLYLYGSLATGGFTPGVSDVDLLAATSDDVTASDLGPLREMHAALVHRHPDWDDRIEIAYLSTTALGSFKERRASLAITSPGEPLHIIDAGVDWLMNWHHLQHCGRRLFGPPPTFITPTTHDEFIESLRDHVRNADDWIARVDNRRAQSYVVLTLCRSLVAFQSGRNVSKQKAADWVRQRHPEWRGLIADALAAREDPASGSDPADPATLAEMNALFVFTRGLV